MYAHMRTQIQSLVPTRMRSTTSGLCLFFLSSLGFGLGAPSVGLLSDLLMPSAGPDSLRFAMLVVTFGHLWAGVHFWFAARTLRADLLLLTTDEAKWERVMTADSGGGARGYEQLDRASTPSTDLVAHQLHVQRQALRDDEDLPPQP